MLTKLPASQPSNAINVNSSLLIAIFVLLFSGYSVRAQTGRALDFDGTNDYISLTSGLTASYTKEAWINPTDLSGFRNIVSGSGTAFFLNAGQLGAGHASGAFGQALDPVPVTAGTWYHVAVTYNATTGDMLLYKNGTLVFTAAAVAGYTEPLLEIGRFGGANNFSGQIDEVRIWNNVRTGAQISAGMGCELTGDEPGLLAYYNFNQGVAGGANAGVTTLNDTKDACQLSNGTLINFDLTGSTSNWVAPGPVLSGVCTNSFANINVTGNGICINYADTSPNTGDFTNFGDFGTLPITRNFVIQNTGNSSLNISGVSIIGANASDFSITVAPAATVAASASTNFSVSFNPSGANGIKNAIIVINNNDEDEGTFPFSIAGNLAGGGKALAFDGINDRVDLPLTFSGSYTKEAWINTNILTGFPNILTGNASTGTGLYLNAGRLAAGHAPIFTQITDPTPLMAGTWYHAAVTYDAATGIMNLYKNGVLVGTAAVPAYTETNQQIGTFNGGNYFNGAIDEVRVWNIVRSAADILSSMNCELNGTETGLLAYYNFNQGAQGGNNTGLTILNDLVGNCPQNGTLVNFALNGSISNWVSPGGTVPASCNAQVANISVAGNNICIATGDITPAVADNTDYGFVNVPNDLDHSFVIHNNGGATLSIASVVISGADATMFTMVSAPATTVLPGGSTTFIVRFTPSGSGIKNATITINNNDANEAAYSFAVTGSAFDPAPVTLLYFKANAAGNYSRLIWETATELNNKGFEIQRSENGSNVWQTIGFVEGKNTPNGSRYSFNDLAPMKGINMYRLNQVDIDGHNSYSNIEAVNFVYDAAIVSVYPNPVADKLNIVFNNSSLLNTHAKITTAAGAVIANIKLSSYRQEVNLAAYAKGLYLISLQDGTVLRIIKQ